MGKSSSARCPAGVWQDQAVPAKAGWPRGALKRGKWLLAGTSHLSQQYHSWMQSLLAGVMASSRLHTYQHAWLCAYSRACHSSYGLACVHARPRDIEARSAEAATSAACQHCRMYHRNVVHVRACRTWKHARLSRSNNKHSMPTLCLVLLTGWLLCMCVHACRTWRPARLSRGSNSTACRQCIVTIMIACVCACLPAGHGGAKG